MKLFIRLTANFIIAFGLIPVLGGIITILGLGNIIHSIPFFGPSPNVLGEALTFFNLATGLAFILGGLVFMALGEFLFLINELTDHVRKIAEK